MDEVFKPAEPEDIPTLPVMCIRPVIPANVAFVNALVCDIGKLECCADDVKYLTVQNATLIMKWSVIDKKVEMLKTIGKDLIDWASNPLMAVNGEGMDEDGDDLSSELCDLIDEIKRDGDNYLDEDRTDVRDIIDTNRIRSNALRLHTLYLMTELYSQSSLFMMFRECCTMLLDVINQVVNAAIQDLDPNQSINCDEHVRLFFINHHNDLMVRNVDVDAAPPSVNLLFKMHDQQIMFSEEEREQIHKHEVEQERLAHEAEVLQQRVAYAKVYATAIADIVKKEPVLQRELGKYLDGIDKLPDAMTCEKVTCLYNTLKWLCKVDADENRSIEAGLFVLADILDGKDTNVYRQLGHINPMEIAMGLSYFPDITVTNLTSKEELVVRNEPYDYPEDTALLITSR